MSDPFAEIFDPLRVLRERAGEVLAQYGLKLRHLAVAPGPGTDGPHEVQILAVLAEEPTASPPDEEFERVMREAREAELERRSSEALQDLQNRLQKPGGFLD